MVAGLQHIGRYHINYLIRSLDRFVVYGDTDSVKLKEGFDVEIINDYNKKIEERLRNVANTLGFDFNLYKPKDENGKEHLIGELELDGLYDKFINLSEKKYAVLKTIKNSKINEDFQKIIKKGEEESQVLEITVAGVPKKAVYQINSIEDFRDDLIFEHKFTNKKMLVYVENQEPFNLKDYTGKKSKVIDISGCCLVPVNHTLMDSVEYEHLLSDDSSKRARYNE